MSSIQISNLESFGKLVDELEFESTPPYEKLMSCLMQAKLNLNQDQHFITEFDPRALSSDYDITKSQTAPDEFFMIS